MTKPKPATRAVCYARVSSSQQAEEGVSLDAQRAKMQAYAGLYGLTVVEWVVDPGESAKTLNRPGLTRALAMLKDGTADALVVMKLDRLTRSVKDLGDLIETYFDKSALLSVEEQIDTRSAGGRLVLNVLASVGQWERESCGERTRTALSHKKARGELTGTAPIGWTATEGIRTADGKRYVSPPRLVADPLEQRAVQRIVELRREGVSWGGIVDTLNGEHVATRAGTRWHITSVRRVFAREQANGRTGNQAEA